MLKEWIESVKNLWRFKDVVWNWRWYDYEYQMNIMARHLELVVDKWGEDTHYVGDTFTKKRIQVVLRWYQMYKEADTLADEYKYRNKFVYGHARLLSRLWD